MNSTLLSAAEVGMMDANATRYLSAVGLVLLLWDHLLTIEDEILLIWPARSSYAKWTFLVNRYLVPGILIGVTYSDPLFLIPSTHLFQRFFIASCLAGVVSIEAGQSLIVLRLVTLWDHDKRIIKIMTGFLVLSSISAFTLMAISLWQLFDGFQYNSLVKMCVSTRRANILSAVWASPMAFMLLVLVSTCWVAFERPRASQTALTKVLIRDGVAVFLILTVLRTFNLVLAAIAPAALTLLGAFFVWSMTTLVLNRSLLNIQKMESLRHDLALSGRSATPFGIEAGSLDTTDYSDVLAEQSQPSGIISRYSSYSLDTKSLRQGSILMSDR